MYNEHVIVHRRTALDVFRYRCLLIRGCAKLTRVVGRQMWVILQIALNFTVSWAKGLPEIAW